MKVGTHLRTATATLAVALGMSQTAWAQQEASATAQLTAADDGFADIVVTAQRRSESLQKVPLAVSAVDSATLLNAGIVNIQQITQVSPSITFNNSGGQFATFIRGVGTRLAPPGLEPSIATYIDDRYEGSANAALVQLLDVQRVEVVKGPQGVLFGRNATGGAIRIIHNDPVDRWEGNVRASYGNYDSVELRGTVNVPVSDSLATRFSALHLRRDGFVTNIFPGGRSELNDANFIVLRNKTKWDITSWLTAKASLDYWRERDTFGQAFVPLPPFELNPLLVGGALGGRNPDEAATALTRPTRQNELSGQLRLDASLDTIKLSSITTFSRPNTHLVADIDATSAVAIDGFDYHVRRRAWTQEVQAVSDGSGPLRWLIGGFYLHEKGMVEVLLSAPFTASSGGRQHVTTNSIAAFGQLSYDITDQLSVTLGGRYGHESKDLYVTATQGAVNLVPLPTPFEDKTSFSKFTPRAVLQWNYSDRGMVYASYSRGIKGGGFSFPAVGQPTLRPEVLDSYEIGWKAELFDRRVQLNTAAFYYRYTDLQVSRTTTLPSGAFSVSTENAASSTIKGLEADLRVRPVRNLTLSGSMTYLDARYDRFPAASGRVFRASTATPGNGLGTVVVSFDASDRQMLYAPKFAAYVSADYGIDLEPGRLNVSATLSHRSSYELDFVIDPLLSVMRQKSYQLLSARLGFDFKSGISVAVFGNNLTDKRFLADASIGSQGPKGIYSDPRTYGVQIGYKF